LKPLPGELEAIQDLKTVLTATRHWDRSLMSPTPDCQISPFGVKRYHNGVYINDYHKGVDLRSPQGRPIKAITDGVVKVAAPQFRLHGGTVGLDHGQGLSSVYIHMSKVAVKTGQAVKKGDVIGYVGSTGFATGPHLHWGLYAGGVPVDPDQWIPVPRCR
jgi:murein DD-endopeptidase MepM/ murein hydrolase activator NlpD